MKKLLSVLIIMLLVPTLVFAKSYEEIFVNYSDSSHEEILNVTGTSDGGYAVVGYHNYGSAFIAKYDNNDKQVWIKKFQHYVNFYDIEETSDGGLIIAGMVVPEGGDLEVELLGSYGWGPQLLLYKLDKDGNEEWITYKYFDSGFAFLYDVEEGTNGNFYAVGVITDGAEGQEHYIDGLNGSVLYVVDKNGKELNYQEFDGLGEEVFYGVVPMDDGSFYVVGHTNSPEYLNITGLVEDQYVPVLAKFSADYKLEWAKKYNADSNVGINKCYEGSNLSYLPVYNDIVKVDDGLIAVGQKFKVSGSTMSTDGLVVKYDFNGNIVWEYTEENVYQDSFEDVVVTKTGKIIAVGTKGYLASDEENNEEELEDICLNTEYGLRFLVLDKNGKKINEHLFDVSENDMFYGVDLMKNGTFVAVGTYASSDLKELELKEINDGIIYRINVDFVITKEKTENGTFEAVENPENEKGIVTLEPDEGYEIGEVKVVDSNGDEVVVTKESDGSYTYDIYDDTWVTVTFEKIPESPKTGVESYLALGVILSFIAVIVYKFSKDKDAFRQI